MEIGLLYVPGCPNRAATRDRIGTAAALAGVTGLVVRERQIASAEEAARWAMRGSPTVLIDGHDPFPTDDAPTMACRLYRDNGKLAGVPPLQGLVDAFSALADEHGHDDAGGR